MKKIELALLVIVLGAVVFLFARERQLQREIAALSATNRELREEATAKPGLDADELRKLTARLEQAELALAAAEKRLTQSEAPRNATASSRPKLNLTRPLPDSPAGVPGETGLDGLFDARKAQAAAGPVSSSHSPDGTLLHRSWGPEQVVGPPNTPEAGDIPTAWAPQSSQSSAEEWLHLGYEQPVEVAEVRVRETYNPGAISKIAAVMPDGRETVVWEGTEPAAQAPVDRSFPVPPGIQANQIKVYLDRQRSPGWNEIDAVELVGRDGTRQWAASASASSSYAENVRSGNGEALSER